jgi:hypothetical protein
MPPARELAEEEGGAPGKHNDVVLEIPMETPVGTGYPALAGMGGVFPPIA